MQRLFILILFLPLFSFVCISKKMKRDTIKVTNNLAEGVYVIPNFRYPDTSFDFTTREHVLANDSIYFIQAHRTKKLFYRDLCNKNTWTYLIKSDTLQVYVFTESIIKNETWATISTEKLFLRKLVFHYNDLIKNNCILTIE